MIMTQRSSSTWVVFASAMAIAAATFVLSAQTPPAAGQAPVVQGAPPAEPGRGGGRGRGVPQESLRGGPQASDPAYADYDWSKKAPVPILRPDEQLKKFQLQPGYRLEL